MSSLTSHALHRPLWLTVPPNPQGRAWCLNPNPKNPKPQPTGSTKREPRLWASQPSSCWPTSRMRSAWSAARSAWSATASTPTSCSGSRAALPPCSCSRVRLNWLHNALLLIMHGRPHHQPWRPDRCSPVITHSMPDSDVASALHARLDLKDSTLTLPLHVLDMKYGFSDGLHVAGACAPCCCCTAFFRLGNASHTPGYSKCGYKVHRVRLPY